MASASDPPAHPALQPADRLILPPLPPRAAVETSIGPPHYPAESTQSHAFVQPSLRARKGHANSDSLCDMNSPLAIEQQMLVRASQPVDSRVVILPSLLHGIFRSARQPAEILGFSRCHSRYKKAA